MSKKEIGKKKLNDVLGQKADAIIERFNAVSPDFAYGDLYARKGYWIVMCSNERAPLFLIRIGVDLCLLTLQN